MRLAQHQGAEDAAVGGESRQTRHAGAGNLAFERGDGDAPKNPVVSIGSFGWANRTVCGEVGREDLNRWRVRPCQFLRVEHGIAILAARRSLDIAVTACRHSAPDVGATRLLGTDLPPRSSQDLNPPAAPGIPFGSPFRVPSLRNARFR